MQGTRSFWAHFLLHASAVEADWFLAGLAKEINASLIIALSMPTLDVAMPFALFAVVITALLLNNRVEGKLQSTVEQKEFKTRDIVLLVVFIAIIVSALAYAATVNPGGIFEDVILIFFLSSYTMLLFTISYVFSGLTKIKAQMVSIGFGSASMVAAVACSLAPLRDSFTLLRIGGFIGLAAFCFGVAVYEEYKPSLKERWYVAAQPAAIFVLLFVFFNVIYNSGTAAVWTPYLMDVFGLTFAVLIILYLGSLFNWKTVGLFAVLLTTMDIILVIGSSVMLTAAQSFSGLGLPVLVVLPNIPIVTQFNAITNTTSIVYRGLGLGDYFFAGILAIQTFKKFGRDTAIVAAVAMAVSFGIWEAFLQDIINALIPILGRNIGGWPATTCMLTGWVPVVAWKMLSDRRKTAKLPAVTQTPLAPQEPSNVPTQ